MKWIGERISYVDNDNKTTIIITPGATGWQKSLMSAWVSMWITLGAATVWYWLTFTLTRQETLILIVFACFWVYYFVRVGRSFFWLLFGAEHIKIDKIAMTVKNSIRGYGSAREYFLENLKKGEVDIPREGSFQAVYENSPWVRGGERISFEYGHKQLRFGKKLSEKEAKALFQVVTARLDKFLRKK